MPALDSIAKFYHKVLFDSDQGAKALEYMRDRGFTDETMRAFGVGFSPLTRVDYTKHRFLTYSESDALVSLEHLFKNESGTYIDRFKGRLLFPVKSSTGRVQGFAGRVLTPNDPQKYLNSAESPSYHKSRCVYGVDLAKQYMFSADKAILCEGYTDAMAFHQVGVKNSVAAGGTYATRHQLSIIARYTKNIYLAFDSDDAGSEATNRTLSAAKEMGLKVGTIDIPKGKDPADVLLK